MNSIVASSLRNGRETALLLVLTGSIVLWAAASAAKGHDVEESQVLSKKQQAIIPIAAFTASGEIGRLKTALQQGLDAGLTLNEVKEIATHLYAYAGFPRSLNALSALMEVVDDRKARGIDDVPGKEASPLPAGLNRDEFGARVRARLSGLDTIPPPARWQQFAPFVDTLLKEHLFADLFARDVLSHQERELVTISALAHMTGTEGQLHFHLGAAMNTGLSEPQMKAFLTLLAAQVGEAPSESARHILSGVLKHRK